MNALAQTIPELTAPSSVDRRTRLVVNADDFGYFASVTDGILDACRAGRVTATGVFANGPALQSRLEQLLALPDVTPGVHLNLTLGVPRTGAMRHRLRRNGGRFPSKVELFTRLASGRLPVGYVADEWRAQIRWVARLGLRPWFLNSHEHVHAWPALGRLADELAREFGIPFVRRVAPEWRLALASGGFARNLVLGVLTARATTLSEPPQAIELLGLAVSGQLDGRYCDRRLADARRGAALELMCHPGRPWPAAPARLRAYHAWGRELDFLTGAEFARLLVGHDVRLVSYADLARESTP